MALKQGTVVWLKSGGPAMTAKAFHKATERYICNWFDGTELCEGRFSEEQLTEEEPGANAKPSGVKRKVF